MCRKQKKNNFKTFKNYFMTKWLAVKTKQESI